MRDWLASLAPRERYILLGGSVLAAVIIAWALVWRPLTVGAVELRATVNEQKELLTNLRRAQSLAELGDVGSGGEEIQSLVVLVDRTHREHGLEGALSRNQPDGSDGIRVTLQDAAFDAIMAWLATLESRYQVMVESASINAGREPGLVSATLVLRRS
jgi:general secretion pathway protein M